MSLLDDTNSVATWVLHIVTRQATMRLKRDETIGPWGFRSGNVEIERHADLFRSFDEMAEVPEKPQAFWRISK